MDRTPGELLALVFLSPLNSRTVSDNKAVERSCWSVVFYDDALLRSHPPATGGETHVPAGRPILVVALPSSFLLLVAMAGALSSFLAVEKKRFRPQWKDRPGGWAACTGQAPVGSITLRPPTHLLSS